MKREALVARRRGQSALALSAGGLVLASGLALVPRAGSVAPTPANSQTSAQYVGVGHNITFFGASESTTIDPLLADARKLLDTHPKDLSIKNFAVDGSVGNPTDTYAEYLTHRIGKATINYILISPNPIDNNHLSTDTLENVDVEFRQGSTYAIIGYGINPDRTVTTTWSDIDESTNTNVLPNDPAITTMLGDQLSADVKAIANGNVTGAQMPVLPADFSSELGLVQESNGSIG